MNYRHLYHAGNFADVCKHVLLLQLIRAMQRKEKGFCYLDTHAGRGGYDLTTTGLLPDGRERTPEWPDGIGRLWNDPAPPPQLTDYLAAVRSAQARFGAGDGPLHYYPGSPWIAQSALRMQDRAAFCELREDDAEALAVDFRNQPNVSVHRMDGYTALRAMLPPPEKRALVLIDPPFEQADEFMAVLNGLNEGLRRLSGGVFAVWYPLTSRARSEEFLGEIAASCRVPALAAELSVRARSETGMHGCGLLVLNPPWQSEEGMRAALAVLAGKLRIDAGAGFSVRWIVPER